MKIKYRVLESQYSDGSVRFFPQCRKDWWHGWGFYVKWLESAYSNHGMQVPIWFDSLEKAKAFLHKEIDWLKTFGQKTTSKPGAYQIKEIVHNCSEDKKK